MSAFSTLRLVASFGAIWLCSGFSRSGVSPFLTSDSTGAKHNAKRFALPSTAEESPLISGYVATNKNSPSHTVSARTARVLTPVSALLGPLLTNSGTASAAEEAAEKSLFEVALSEYFPGSFPNSLVASKIMSALKLRGYTTANTLLGASLCSDEINDTAASLIGTLQRKITNNPDGGVFNLGGLGGLPFVGTTGFGAFFSHCPDNGKVFILFGPHVGISKDGVVGKVERIGVSNPSSSCGAGAGAYKAILADVEGKELPVSPRMDFQQKYIIETLEAKLGFQLGILAGKGALGADQSIALVTNKLYDMVSELVKGEVQAMTSKKTFWDKVSEVTLMGGVVINRGFNQGEDFFEPLYMRSFTAEGEADIFTEVLGVAPPKRFRMTAIAT